MCLVKSRIYDSINFSNSVRWRANDKIVRLDGRLAHSHVDRVALNTDHKRRKFLASNFQKISALVGYLEKLAFGLAPPKEAPAHCRPASPSAIGRPSSSTRIDSGFAFNTEQRGSH